MYKVFFFTSIFYSYFFISDVALSQKKKKSQATVNVDIIKRKKSKGKGARAKPNYNLASVVSTTERKLIKGIRKTLIFLKRTVNRLPRKSGARLEMLEKMINLTLEQAAYIAGTEQDIYEKKWKIWDQKNRKGREPQINNSRSNAHWMQVYKHSQVILKEYPTGKNSDLMAFNGALALQFMRKHDEATREFKKIIKMYPKSNIAGDAQFSLGDYYFDRNQFRKALGHYKSAIKYRRSRRYGWALFKLGWCSYNINQYSSALSYWHKTVDYSKKNDAKKNARLKDEAMRDMIYAYAELQKIDEAIRFYKRNSGDEYISKLLKVLAETFSEQGKFKKSIVAWKRLLRMFPGSSEAFDAQSEIIALTFEGQNYKNLWIELEKLQKQYSPGSRWASKNTSSRVKEAQVQMKKVSLYYPKVIHKSAQKSKSKRGFNEAKKGYYIYLKKYKQGKDNAEIMEYLGDIEYFQKNYKEAGGIYLSIVQLGKNKAFLYDDNGKPKKNIHQRSAKNMLDSYNKDFLPELKALLKIKPNYKKPPKALSKRAKNFIKACDTYTKHYPKDNKTVENCETFIGEIYFRNQHKKDALKYLWIVAKKHSKNSKGRTAVDNLIPMYKNDSPALVKTVQTLLAIPAYRKGKIGKKLKVLARGLQVEKISSESAPLKRAQKFEDHARKNPKDKEADKFWNNAAVDYLKAGSLSKALNAFEMIVKRYPKSPLLAGTIIQLGTLYDETMNYQQASKNYSLYAKRFPKAKEAPGALQRSCELQIAINPTKAITICSKFAKRYPTGGAAALEKLIDSLWREKKYSPMNRLILRNYIPKFRLSANQKIVAYYKVFKSSGSRSSRGEKARQNILGTARTARGISGEALRYLGEIIFSDVQALQKKFNRMRLRGGGPNQLQKSIESIFNSLVQLEKAYNKVFSTRDSYWGVAAFYQLGESFESFANQLKNPPTINGVKNSDLVKQLQPSINQVLGKAKEYYSTGIQTARQFTIYNIWTTKIFNGLNRVLKRKVSFAELIVDPDFVGSEVPSEVGGKF